VVAVRMSEEDFSLLKRAADEIWPRAILTNSSIILGLAKIHAEEVLGIQHKPKKARSA